VFVAAVRYPGWLPFRLLNLAWVRFLGVLSYSIYLVHPAVLWGVTSWTRLPAVLQAALGLGLTLVIALAIYEAVEKPAARLRRRLSRVDAPSEPERVARPVGTGRPAPLAQPEAAP
jgi:peptidoglycan/LPS O-acetylase OafA/YrhL